MERIFCIGVLEMRSDCIVTIWHFDDEKDVPVRKVFAGILENAVYKMSKNGIKQKGFYLGDGMGVRIFTEEEIGITPGDYICKGDCKEPFPDGLNSRKIVEVRDSRRGANPHWRVLCGG